jgi:isoquinoline 1-oxidoreductase beta subunit
VRLEQGDDGVRHPGQNLARKRVWGEMGTGGSRGIRTSEDYVRRGGAVARTMLLQAAADQWNVPVGELRVSDGVITHAGSGRRTTYGKVAEAAAKLTPPDPKSITLKNPKDWKIAGKPVKRLDTADKLNGSKVYAIDVKLPGMLHAAVKACPVFGGTLVSFDESKIAGRPGVRRAVKVNESTVAVVADTWWHAKRALDALPIVWDEGAGATQSSATIAAHLAEGLGASEAYAFRKEGDAPAAIQSAAKKVEAVYSTPFLAPRDDGADDLHGEDLGGQGPSAGCRRRTAKPRWPRCPSSREFRSPSARSTSTTSAAASAGAAERRTSSVRPRSSPSSSRRARSR